MKTALNNKLRQVPEIKDETLCRLYSNIGAFLSQLDAPKDASHAKEAKLRSVPAEMLPMIF